jgi:HEAT repeat protein
VVAGFRIHPEVLFLAVATLAHPRKTEDCLDALTRLRDTLPAPAARAELERYLAHKSNQVVAKAAKLVADCELHDLSPALVEAFHRFMRDPATSDRGCAAKTGIVRALEALGAAEDAVFLAGIRHVQMEGSFGPPVDTAPALRAASAMGLVHMNHPGAVLEIVTLLMDREPDARIGAVRALAWAGGPEAVPLLRLKVLQPDPSVDVRAECFTALLALAPGLSLDFVAAYLDAPDPAIVEAAALALGDSRQPAAIDALKSKWERCPLDPLRRALLTGLAVAREESAFDFLFSLVENANEKTAGEALSALAMYRHDERIRSRVATLVIARKNQIIKQLFDAAFDLP